MAKIDLITVPLLDWPFSVLSVASAPPSTPVLNDCYLIGASPTGAWSGRAGQIARRNAAAAWEYQTPTEGRTVYDRSANLPRRWDGSAWVVFEATAADIAALQAADAAHDVSIASAASAAATAQSTAAGAASAAATAQSTADAATLDAAAAQATADTALANASTAQTAASTAQSTAAAALAAIPTGGTTGQILAKASNADRDTQWIPAPSGGGGGGGDITDVSAGDGLTGGGATGSVTLAIDFGTGVNQTRRGNDAAYTDARAPTTHASSHADGGPDELNVSGLSGVLADPQRANVIAATGGNLNVGTIADGQMLVRSGATVVSAPIPTGDITSVTAGTGLSGGATSGDATLSVVYGTAAGTSAQGNDSRLSDDRTASGIRTATTVVSVSAAAAPSAGQALVATGPSAAAWQTIVAGGGDITAVIAGTGLSGGATTGDATLAVVYGSSAGTAAEGNDARLSDARAPTAHKTTHATGGPDAIAPADIGAVPTTRALIAGTGLTGGGNLSVDPMLAVAYGSTAGTAAEGNDARLSNDRTASGLRTVSSVVAISTAAAPTAGQVLEATGPSAAIWVNRTNVVHASQVRADTALGTSALTVASVVFPSAGTYNLDLSVRFVVTSGAPNVLTGTFDHASMSDLGGTWIRQRRNYTVDVDRTYAKPTLFASRSASVGEVHTITFRGHCVMSAGATVPLTVALSAGAGALLAGTYVTVALESANVTPFGYPNFIQLTSGVGYAGSVLTSSSAGQWTADGVAIVGQTGATYTVTRADEGKELRCGNSNPFQRWTPLHLPDVYKTDGTNFGGWWDPAYASTVTLNGGNVASIANLFSGGPALAQATAANQPPYVSGGAVHNGTAHSLNAGAIVAPYVASVLTLGTGVEIQLGAVYRPTFANNTTDAVNADRAPIFDLTASSRVTGNTSFVNGRPSSGSAGVAVLPCPKSLLERMSAGRGITGGYTLFGTGLPASTFFFSGTVFEVLCLASAAHQTLQTQIQGYLAHHNGIANSLPPDHPYYAAPPRIS